MLRPDQQVVASLQLQLFYKFVKVARTQLGGSTTCSARHDNQFGCHMFPF